MEDIFVPERICELLQLAMMKETDLAAAIYRAHRVPDPQRDGYFRCSCTVAVPRPMDPETAALRELQVLLKKTVTGFEVCAVEGLEADDEP